MVGHGDTVNWHWRTWLIDGVECWAYFYHLSYTTVTAAYAVVTLSNVYAHLQQWLLLDAWEVWHPSTHGHVTQSLTFKPTGLVYYRPKSNRVLHITFQNLCCLAFPTLLWFVDWLSEFFRSHFWYASHFYITQEKVHTGSSTRMFSIQL